VVHLLEDRRRISDLSNLRLHLRQSCLLLLLLQGLVLVLGLVRGHRGRRMQAGLDYL
jgi:hypothetical protein